MPSPTHPKHDSTPAKDLVRRWMSGAKLSPEDSYAIGALLDRNWVEQLSSMTGEAHRG